MSSISLVLRILTTQPEHSRLDCYFILFLWRSLLFSQPLTDVINKVPTRTLRAEIGTGKSMSKTTYNNNINTNRFIVAVAAVAASTTTTTSTTKRNGDAYVHHFRDWGGGLTEAYAPAWYPSATTSQSNCLTRTFSSLKASHRLMLTVLDFPVCLPSSSFLDSCSRELARPGLHRSSTISSVARGTQCLLLYILGEGEPRPTPSSSFMTAKMEASVYDFPSPPSYIFPGSGLIPPTIAVRTATTRWFGGLSASFPEAGGAEGGVPPKKTILKTHSKRRLSSGENVKHYPRGGSRFRHNLTNEIIVNYV